jgi:hypothetical protein
MSNVLASGVEWLMGKVKANAAETVTYSRSASSVSVNAILGRTQTEQPINDSGATVRSNWIDFLIDGDDLVISAATIKPQQGDTITRSDGAVYEVTAMGSEPCFRRSSEHGTLLRIHTMRVSE